MPSPESAWDELDEADELDLNANTTSVSTSDELVQQLLGPPLAPGSALLLNLTRAVASAGPTLGGSQYSQSMADGRCVGMLYMRSLHDFSQVSHTQPADGCIRWLPGRMGAACSPAAAGCQRQW